MHDLLLENRGALTRPPEGRVVVRMIQRLLLRDSSRTPRIAIPLVKERFKPNLEQYDSYRIRILGGQIPSLNDQQAFGALRGLTL